MKNNFNKAFTLVELIVVITILAVLATVAFISFQWYTSSSRDSVRLADLKNIEKQLNIHFTQNNIYPDPSDAVSIPTGWTQGELAKWVTNQIWVSEVTDPLTKDYYFYRTSENKRKYQLLGFLENGDFISKNPVQNTFAQNDIPYSKWDKLGIILNSDGKTLPETIDFATQTYDVIFSNAIEENLINITWEDNFIELKAAEKWFFDESLVWYWDMETLTSDGKLADLSGNNNHGTIHDENNSGLATPVNWEMVFDGVDDYVEIDDSDELDGFEEFTFIFKINLVKNLREQFLINKMVHYTWNTMDDSYWYRIRGDGTSFIQLSNDSDWHVSSSFYSQDPKWIYMLRYDQNKVELIVDNTLVQSANNILLSGNVNKVPENIFIWRPNPNPNISFIEWKLDEIMIFNRALSQWEINNIYETLK